MHASTRIGMALVGVLAVFATACTPTPGDEAVATTTTQTTSADIPSTSTSTSTSTTTTQSDPTTSSTLSLDDVRLSLVEVGAGFDQPIFLIADPDGGADLVVEQPGRVVRFGDTRTVVLNITNDVGSGGERGLLGLAFHPEFAENRLAYVNFTGPDGATVIEEFQVDNDGTFRLESRRVILTIDQPAPNHNGGMIAFGPDGYLWIGMGDGGAADDKFDNGQRSDTLLAAMLRIAVGTGDGSLYSVPQDNPFADGVGGAPEVWATGLRNPWRFSFDGDTLWIADVGQGAREEVDAVNASGVGLNFGWPIMEGSSCFQATDCDRSGLVLPVTEYGRDVGCSITGGYVYRGAAIPALVGHYFFADYCSGILRSFEPSAGEVDWSDQTGPMQAPVSFGVGGDGELYVVYQGGSVFRLEGSL
jgi:glucose/arabinose dehydrogenase